MGDAAANGHLDIVEIRAVAGHLETIADARAGRGNERFGLFVGPESGLCK